LSEIIVDFYDMVKSASQGYASMGYQFLDYRRGDLIKLNILIAGEPAEALAAIVPREEAYHKAQELVRRLKELIPPENFTVAVQGAIDGKIIARETIPALKKDVTGYLYGGDRSRKMKLWSKQKKGKKRLKERGRVAVPSDVYRKIFQKSYEA
ncbi:MAG: elongation factor 4, partial [Patescibacteria group bacterium]